MHCFLCIIFYTLYYMHCILCIMFYALYSMHCILCIAFFSLYSMHCILCIVFYALYSINGILRILCILNMGKFFLLISKLVAHRPTDRQTNRQTDRRTLSHIELLLQLKMLEMKITSNERQPQSIKSWIYQPPPIRYSSSFKLKLSEPNQKKKCLKWRRPSMEDNLKIFKFESQQPLIWSSSNLKLKLRGTNQNKNSSIEDDLQWMMTSKY
jgi:hypothetical protein